MVVFLSWKCMEGGYRSVFAYVDSEPARALGGRRMGNNDDAGNQ